MNTDSKLAILDIDGTLFRSSLLIELINQLIKNQVFPEEISDIYEKEFLAWQTRTGTYEAYISKIIKAFMENLKGVHYHPFAKASQQVADKMLGHRYRYTSSLIQSLKQGGYTLAAVSQSPKTILDMFCKKLGFDLVYGRIYETDSDNIFTGKVTKEDIIQDKSLVVKRITERLRISTEQSYGVGDTEGDIPLLKSVANPICFNPNQALYTAATIHNWPIIIERKNLILKLQNGNYHEVLT